MKEEFKSKRSSGGNPSGRGKNGGNGYRRGERSGEGRPADQGERFGGRQSTPYKQARTERSAGNTEHRAEAYAQAEDGEMLNGNTAANSNAVAGRNAVRELLKSDREIDKIFVRRGEREGSVTVLVAQALDRKIPVIEVEKQKLDSMVPGVNHQGIVALAAEKSYATVDDMLALAAERGEKPLLVVAEGVEDPHNLGAIIRSAEGAGAHGVIISKRRASGLTATVGKASAGALEHMLVAKVPNIASEIEDLKKKGLWIYAAEAGGQMYYDCDMSGAVAIVLGSEGEGVSRLVKDRSDFVVSIPMNGKVNSLNVSNAAAILVYEAALQQRGIKRGK